MTENLRKGFRLGTVEVRPDENALLVDGDRVRVEPKAMAVLVALAERGLEVVGRETLIARVWPRGYVTDDALNRCISHLRQALGDDSRSPRFIATVPRRGYRLAHPVDPLERAAEASGTVVLPFQNLSSAAEDYIADGLTELLIARLSVALDQPVISRTTAMSFKHTQRDLRSISRQLGVRWVVEGSVMQVGDEAQIVVQLIDAETDTHVWAETWSRPVVDLLTVLNEVSRLVAGRIRARLQPDEGKAEREPGLPTDLMRQYLHGVQLLSRRTHESLRKAIACFEAVMAARPGHADALAGMAAAHVLLAHYGACPPAEGFGKGREFAQAALASDPGQVAAQVHLAAVEFFHDWAFERAEQRVQGALATDPNNGIGLILAANIQLVRRRYEAAQSLVDRALERDPLNVGLLMNAGDHLILQRRFGEAALALSDALNIDPEFRPARLRRALALAWDDRLADARSDLDKAGATGGEDPVWLEYLAIVEGRAGHQHSAGEAAARLTACVDPKSPGGAWSLARAWASAGDLQRAESLLRVAFEERSSSMPFLGLTPVFEELRSLPGVQALMHRVGLD